MGGALTGRGPLVLIVITRGEPGGAQVHVRDLIAGLRRRVRFHLALGEDDFLAREVRALGVPVEVVGSLQREVVAGGDLRAVRALRALIRRLRPDLVHTHSTKAGLLGRIAAWSCGVRCVHTAHAWSFSDGLPRRRVAAAVPPEWLVGRLTDRFIVVSEADREVGVRYGVAAPERVRVVHNGVADTPGRADPTRSPPVFTMVARLAPPKDPCLLLRAIAPLPDTFRVQLVGDGPDRERVEREITRLDLGRRVTLLGRRGDVADVLAASQVGVLVSRQEGFPLVVLESMRAGLPVLASDVGGVREAVGPDVGRLVARGDEVGWRQAIAALAGDPELRARLGRGARAAFERRFTVERMIEDTWRVYAELQEAA